jgi:hypothetical protein
MAKSTRDIMRAPKRRPAETGLAIVVRMQPDPLAQLDDWRRQQRDLPSRPEAIRRLVELGVKAKQKKR